MNASGPAEPRTTRTRPARIRASIVGAGRIAEEHLTAIATGDDAELVGVCDANMLLAAFATRRFGGTAFTDLEVMLRESRPDVLHVLTPPRFHVPMAVTALSSGAHVLVEKPMALDREGRETLLGASMEASRSVVEDHNYRFNRPMIRLERDVAAGAVGTVVDVEVRVAMPLAAGSRYADRNLPSPSHELPAGFIHEFLTHMAYLVVAFTDVTHVATANWAKRIAGHGSAFDEFDAILDAGAITARLRFTARAPRTSIAVIVTGTEGRAEAEMIFGSYRLERPRSVGEQLTPVVNSVAVGLASTARGVGYVADRLRGRTAYEGLHELVRRFHHAVRLGVDPPVSADTMRRTGELVDELVGSMPSAAEGGWNR